MSLGRKQIKRVVKLGSRPELVPKYFPSGPVKPRLPGTSGQILSAPSVVDSCRSQRVGKGLAVELRIMTGVRLATNVYNAFNLILFQQRDECVDGVTAVADSVKRGTGFRFYTLTKSVERPRLSANAEFRRPGSISPRLPIYDIRITPPVLQTGFSTPGTTITASVIQQRSQGDSVWRRRRKS